jgi:hypothetical protein
VSALVFLVTLAVSGAGFGTDQTAPARTTTPRSYDTPEQTQKKIIELAKWALAHPRDADRPVYQSKEYWNRVVAIVEAREPRPISYVDYKALETGSAYIPGKGEWFATVVLQLGLRYQERSRTSLEGDEIVVYQWMNEDGSNVAATFRDDRLVSKTQIGLK